MIVVYPLMVLLVLLWGFNVLMDAIDGFKRDRKIEAARRYRIKNNIPERDIIKDLEEVLNPQGDTYDKDGYYVRPDGWYFCDPATLIAGPDPRHPPQGSMLPPFPDRPAISERL
jgi:hypothetical protein